MKRIKRINHVHARIDEMDSGVKTESEYVQSEYVLRRSD